MSSAICQNFVQNAWKKELCANCFKSKDEHSLPTTKGAAAVAPPSLNLCKDVKGIIKGAERFRPKRSVCFMADLTKVIGFGGEDWSGEADAAMDDEDGFEMVEEDGEGHEAEAEDDAELRRLTKANTDFNTTSLAAECGDTKKSYTHLMLGKPQVGADGRKQTLQVSVTPFGQDSLPASCKKFGKAVSHIPIAKSSKECVAVEAKTSVVLTSYSKSAESAPVAREEKSLLDEISETLENSKHPIQIISTTRKKTQKEIVLAVAKPEALQETAGQCKDMPDGGKGGKESIERKNGIARAAPIFKKDQEKPVVYQTSTAKIELLNAKNLRLGRGSATGKTAAPGENAAESVKSVSKFVKEEILNVAEEEEKREAVEKGEDLDKRDVEGSSLTETTTNFVKAEKKIVGLPPQVPKYQNVLFTQQSREQAGEPDGRADPDVVNEPPALPLTPPPNLEVQASFLHSGGGGAAQQIYDKPKVPSKPATMAVRKQQQQTPGNNNLEWLGNNNQVLTTFSTTTTEAAKSPEEKAVVGKAERKPEPTDFARVLTNANNKRKAPKPPLCEESVSIYTRHSTGPINFDSPVVREKEKRERASSCSPKIRNVSAADVVAVNLTPEPAPRRLLSLSTDSLASTCSGGGGGDERRKEKTKGRFSLKKFLRMGGSTSKDVHKCPDAVQNLGGGGLPQPKPRLVIVHPIDLNGAKVEVLSKPNNNSGEVADYNGGPANSVTVTKFGPINGNSEEARQPKPPPPPRYSSAEDGGRSNKPSIPHPPKSAEIISKQKQYVRNCQNKKVDSVYANIGEVRSAITPNKPQRTASMREREAQQERKAAVMMMSNGKVQNKDLGGGGENVYDYILNNGSARSSSPECDSSSSSSPDKTSPTSNKQRLSTRNGLALNKQRSESSVDVSGEYFKFQNIPRSMSLTYCGSETESEIYSPYSFYGSETEITEDDHDWTAQNRTHKLRSRKGRSIVHKNLEDNYGAVIVANHEALAQVLENIQQTTLIQPALRGLKTTSNLSWTDFTVKGTVAPIFVGTRAFHQALWNVHHVTLMLSPGSLSISPLSLGTFGLVPITEFSDLIPEKYLFPDSGEDNKNIQATIAVFPWIQISTIQAFGETLKNKTSQNREDVCKEASFVLLQMVNALKMLQAQGIEELQLSLNSFVLCREMDKDVHYRLCVLQGLGEELSQKNGEKYGSLCQCASKTLMELLPISVTTSLIESLLNTERAVSLTQVKSVLEFSLWGPSDVALSSTIRERELALQRWLDLQRATVLHGLVCTRVQLTVHEEYHLMFLVRSNARMMCDASLLLESSNAQHAHNSK